MATAPSHADAGRSLSSLLAERRTLPAAAALALIRSLAAQLAELHAAGTIHGHLVPSCVRLNEVDEPRLETASPGSISSRAGEWAGLIPELVKIPGLELPARIKAVQKQIVDAGLNINPRQIDFCQLGALFCRILTGEPAARKER